MQSYVIDRGVIRFLFSFLKGYKLFIFSCFCVALWWGLSMSLEASAVRGILNQAAMDPSWQGFVKPLGFYAFLIIAYGLNFRIYDLVCLRYYPRLKQELFVFVTQKVTNKDYHFYQDRYAGDLASKVKDIVHGTLDIIKIICDYITGQFFAIAIAGYFLWQIQPLLFFVLLTTSAIILGASAFATCYGKNLSKDLYSAQSQAVGNIVDWFTNFLTVKTFARDRFEEERFRYQVTKISQEDRRLRWFMTVTHAVQMFGTWCLLLGTIIVMIFSVQSHHLTVGDFGFVFVFTMLIASSTWSLSKEFTRLSESFGLVQQTLDLLNLPTKVIDREDAQELIVRKGEISFKNVSFKYPGTVPLFSRKTIIISSGEKVGLVGYSGGGKSTFVNLVLRLYDVQEGAIYIDDQDIKGVTQESLHRAITYIPQDPILFHRSLYDNIAYAKQGASHEEVIIAAKKAYAHDFIMQVPGGYEACVGERGVKLSGGQRQRIAIARAFLKNSRVLIMDEPTSSLDSVTEALIQKGLDELVSNKTVIIIAHRLSTLRFMDRILVLDKGKIIQDGSLEELQHQKGHFHDLWAAQVGGLLPDTV